MRKNTDLLEQLLAEMFAPVSQRNYLDLYYESCTKLHHIGTSGEILGLLVLTHLSEQTETLLYCTFL